LSSGEDVARRPPPALEARISIAVASGALSFTVRAELSLDAGVLILFGPSGVGKTLTVQAIAGLLEPASGWIRATDEVLFDKERRVDVPAHKRRIGYVPQQTSLFPFLSVAENVVFGLPRAQRKRSPEILALMDELGIHHLADARPASLSGGERQRVALARALAVKPRLLLLDEPFASIDQEGRASLRRVLRRTLASRGVPAVFVTHDENEAIELGDSLVLFERGRTIAAGSPASLLRSARKVVLSGVIDGRPERLEDGRVRASLRGGTIEAPADLLSGREGGEEGGEEQEEEEGEEDADAARQIRLELAEP
jgi:molybdate transport system ATP-binding protein